MGLLLGIDLGTSYFKVGLFDECGELKGLGRMAVEKSELAPGRCELAVSTFWHALREALRQALQQASATPQQITGISYSSQASTFLLLDAQDQPLTPFIVWLDARGADLEPELAAFSSTDRFQQVVGFRGVTAQSAVSKWRWFQREQPTLWNSARSVMTIADYLTFSLTGERVGDGGTAAFVGAFDLKGRRWWPTALTAFEIDPGKLSAPLLPGSPCGQTIASATTLLGLPPRIPFAVGSLDHHAGAIGAGLGRFANVSITTGTVLAALALVDDVRPIAGSFHGPHVDGKSFYRLAFEATGAVRLEAYQRSAAPHLSVGALLALAESPACTSDEPHGLAVRRIIEELAVTHRDLVHRIAGPLLENNLLATGGGAQSSLWLQVQARAIGRTLVTSRSPEQGCLGAAIFASVAAHHYSTLAEAQSAMTSAGDSFPAA